MRRFPIEAETETAQSLERKTMQALEPFAQRIIARAVEAQAKLPTTPNIGGRYVSRDEMEAMKQIRDGDDVEKKSARSGSRLTTAHTSKSTVKNTP